MPSLRALVAASREATCPWRPSLLPLGGYTQTQTEEDFVDDELVHRGDVEAALKSQEQAMIKQVDAMVEEVVRLQAEICAHAKKARETEESMTSELIK